MSPQEAIRAFLHLLDTIMQDSNITPSGDLAQPRKHGERTEEHAARSAVGAAPSNTAPSNCTILRNGIDSLYLSFRGELSEEGSTRLEVAREAARSNIEYEQALAQISVLDHQFEAKPTGGRMFKYMLKDHAFNIRLASKNAKNLPFATCQIASHYLTSAGVESAINELRLILGCFGVLEPGASVSRIDLFADFVSPYELSSWDDQSWVTRAVYLDRHRVSGALSGWSIGRGGVMLARLYDKTLQIRTSGQDYLPALWMARGWDGLGHVHRLEFQYRNEVLRQLGSNRYPDVLDKLAGLWAYASQDWLRLTLPNPEDQTRSRWPTHPLWTALQSAPWEGLDEVERISSLPDQAPRDEKLCGFFFAALTSYMAAKGLTDPHHATLALLEAAESFYDAQADFNGEGFCDHAITRAARKALQFRVPFPGIAELARKRQTQTVADAYRKASGR